MSDKSRKYNLYPSHISHGNRGAGKSNRTADENEGSSFIDSIKGSVIGAGTLVSKDVPAGSVVLDKRNKTIKER